MSDSSEFNPNTGTNDEPSPEIDFVEDPDDAEEEEYPESPRYEDYLKKYDPKPDGVEEDTLNKLYDPGDY